MDKKYWNEKWAKGDVGFHREEVQPYLPKYWDALSPTKIFVPLCGKSRDMEWFRKKGHEVVGVDLEAVACEAFLKQSGIDYELEKRGNFSVYRADQITLWCGDFFELPKEALKDITLIFDRAALVALPEAERRRYSKMCAQSLAPAGKSARMLLISYEYPQSSGVVGPPFSVTEKEVTALYGSTFSVHLADRKMDLAFRTHRKFMGICDVDTAVYLLESK